MDVESFQSQCGVFSLWGHESPTQVTNQLHEVKQEIFPRKKYPTVFHFNKCSHHLSINLPVLVISLTVLLGVEVFFLKYRHLRSPYNAKKKVKFYKTVCQPAYCRRKDFWGISMESLEASFRSCLCQLKQFEGIYVAVKKQFYLYIACAASLIVWNMPFGCLPVICE